MAPRRLVLLVVLVALLPGSARADNPTLTGTVGTNDDFQISLSDANGPVKHLAAGTYTLLVHDRSTFHNFHLFGPGVDVATTVDGTGDQTFTITVADGTYTFQCDPHSSTMKSTFTAGNVTAPPPPAPKLSGSITGSKVVLNGIAGLSPGKVVVTIKDKSRTDGFVLTGPGVAKKTGVAFTGTVRWSVALRPGTYRYGSVKTRKRLTFFVS